MPVLLLGRSWPECAHGLLPITQVSLPSNDGRFQPELPHEFLAPRVLTLALQNFVAVLHVEISAHHLQVHKLGHAKLTMKSDKMFLS